MGNTMNAADLHRILSDAKQFRSTDPVFPTLGIVRLEARGGNLVAVATDRYTLGMSRADYVGEDFAANLSASTTDNLIRLAKTTRAAAAGRTVDVDIPDSSDGNATTVNFAFSTGETLTVTCDTGDFPAFRQLIPADRIDSYAQADAIAGYNAAYLARFAKVQGSENMRTFSRGRTKPIVVTIGDDFVGLLMQTRVDGGACFTRPAWAEV